MDQQHELVLDQRHADCRSFVLEACGLRARTHLGDDGVERGDPVLRLRLGISRALESTIETEKQNRSDLSRACSRLAFCPRSRALALVGVLNVSVS